MQGSQDKQGHPCLFVKTYPDLDPPQSARHLKEEKKKIDDTQNKNEGQAADSHGKHSLSGWRLGPKKHPANGSNRKI
jgi:hypothetical protein